ncbi:MAG: amino acid ABC transporter permease [Oscillospiraceae bacterium]|nr:amino acid ABC transporter permease [Oscillospiraceae bacterium]
MTEWFANLSHHFYRNFIYDNRWEWLLDGLWVTVRVSIAGIILGIILGCIVAAMRLSKVNIFGKYFGLGGIDKVINKILRIISYLYLDIVRGTPSVTQIFIWYFVFFAPTNVPRIIVAIIAIGFNSGAYVAEIMRAGVLSIDKGQTEAGRSLGLTSFSTMGFIVMPQAVKNVLPALVNEFIVLIKETAIISFIAVQDLNRAAVVIRGRTFHAWMPIIAAAVIYYIIIKILTIFLRRLEKKIRQSDAR